MYELDYYMTKLNQTAAGLNPGVVSLSDGDSRIVFTNPVDIMRVYRDMQKQLWEQLTAQVYAYRQNLAQPGSVDFPFILNGVFGYGGVDQPAGYPRGYYRS